MIALFATALHTLRVGEWGRYEADDCSVVETAACIEQRARICSSMCFSGVVSGLFRRLS